MKPNRACFRTATLCLAILGLGMAACQQKTLQEESAAYVAPDFPSIHESTPEASGKARKRQPASASNSAAPADRAEKRQAYPKGWNPDVAIAPASGHPDVTHTAGNRAQPYVALTFDDGPHGSLTPRLLDILRERNVKATFFLLGRNVQAQPGIVARITAEGHEVANHSWSHRLMTKASNPVVMKEFQDTHDAILAAGGAAPRVQRPPYGAMTMEQRAMLKDSLGYSCILWDVDPMDWKKPGASVVAARVLDKTRNGSIILLHDIHAGSVDAVPEILDGLIARGHVFVTVSQLLSMQ